VLSRPVHVGGFVRDRGPAAQPAERVAPGIKAGRLRRESSGADRFNEAVGWGSGPLRLFTEHGLALGDSQGLRLRTVKVALAAGEMDRGLQPAEVPVLPNRSPGPLADKLAEHRGRHVLGRLAEEGPGEDVARLFVGEDGLVVELRPVRLEEVVEHVATREDRLPYPMYRDRSRGISL
jgi:hypothetical protein